MMVKECLTETVVNTQLVNQNYIVIDVESPDKHLIDDIENILNDFSHTIFSLEFKSLNQRVQQLFVDAVYNRYDVIERRLTACPDRILFGLITTRLFREMKRTLRSLNIFDKIEEYETSHRLIDKKCHDFLNHVVDRTLFKNDYQNRVFERVVGRDVKILDMAIEGKSLQFLSSKYCQAEVRKRWNPVFRMTSSWQTLDILRVIATVVFPYFYLLGKSNRKAYYKEYGSSNGTLGSRALFFFKNIVFIPYAVYSSPSYMFFFQWLFRFFYSSLMLWKLMEGDPYPLNHYLSGWISCFYIQLLFLTDTVGKVSYVMWKTPTDSPGTLFKEVIEQCCGFETALFFLIVFTVLLNIFFQGVLISIILQIAFDLLFYACFIYSTLYLLFILSLDHFYSSIILTIKKMAVFTFRFFLLFFVFWVAYGVCVVSIRDSYTKSTTRTHVFWRVLKSGSFEIFGETEDKFAETVQCGDDPFDWNNVTSPALNCLVDSWLLPSSLFLYMFIAAVVLVNLLTAFLTQIHEDHKESRVYYKNYMKCLYLIKLEKAFWFPPFSYWPKFFKEFIIEGAQLIRAKDTTVSQTGETIALTREEARREVIDIRKYITTCEDETNLFAHEILHEYGPLLQPEIDA